MAVFTMFTLVTSNVGQLKSCSLTIRNTLKNMFTTFILKTISKLTFENLKFSSKFSK